MLFNAVRAQGHGGEPMKDVDHNFQANGDFVSTV